MRRLLGKLAGLFAILVLLLISQLATTNVVAGEDLAIDETGELNGVTYKIKVPVDWNGKLLMYAHGYIRHDPPTLVPMQIEMIYGSALEEGLLARRYALAASSYSKAGWAVKEGTKNTKKLTEYFAKRVRKPDYTIVWGISMGSVITLTSIEEYPDTYDGAIVLSHIGAGTTLTFDKTLDIATAYDAVFGWPAAWGSVGDVCDNLNFINDVIPVLMPQVQDPANFGKFEFMRLVNSSPYEGYYNGAPPINSWLLGGMFFTTEARAELQVRASGQPVQNLNHTYTLNEYDRGYLDYLGVDADALLSTMNEQTVIEADPSARNYLEKYADFTGELKRPVLMLQPKGDGMTDTANSAVYQGTVEASGASDFLVQTYTNGYMHVVFTPDQVYAAFEAMKNWLETGIRPSSDSFLPALGFDNDYTPPDWPHPTTE